MKVKKSTFIWSCLGILILWSQSNKKQCKAGKFIFKQQWHWNKLSDTGNFSSCAVCCSWKNRWRIPMSITIRSTFIYFYDIWDVIDHSFNWCNSELSVIRIQEGGLTETWHVHKKKHFGGRETLKREQNRTGQCTFHDERMLIYLEKNSMAAANV